MIEILIELELLRAKRDLKVFVLDPSHLVECKKLEVDWEIAPDRILRMFDQPLRKGTAK